MNISIDLHSHSHYSRGVGEITLKAVETAMRYKGIDVLGVK
jgi:PHP family Zn ribbon phosphoesterase